MDPIDTIMQQASEALVATRYLRCEKLCLEALQRCRDAEDYDRFARILLPLQEARRQRRQAALEAGVFVFSTKRRPVESILDDHPTGCLMLIDPPFDSDDEQFLRETALQRELMVEVLRLDQATLRATFEHEMERLGDAELARVSAKRPAVEQVAILCDVLQRVGDHEIAHQRLAEAARRASHEQATRHE